MHLIIASATCKPESREAVAEVLMTLTAASRGDDGCLSYDFHASIEDPNTFRSIETWESAETAGAHLEQPHVATALTDLAPLLATEPEIMMHDVADTTQLA